ncbi:MAG: winged helix-turn-helix transcriptional regulator [Acidobacteria bacterium]|nr:winged helix-turn-helix transcriptional regulator [Acidobacteriota bacterium]
MPCIWSSRPISASTRREAHVLAHLATFGDSTVNNIHKAFAPKRSTLTSILDRLAARGLITRHSSEADRRTIIIRLPAGGRNLLTKFMDTCKPSKNGPGERKQAGIEELSAGADQGRTAAAMQSQN